MAYRRIAEYGEDDFPSPGNGFSAIGDNTPKCNRFVADVAIEAGVDVPAIHVTPRLLIPDGTYPPLANEWANGDVPILGWTYLGRDVYPEPGFIAGHPASSMDWDWATMAVTADFGGECQSSLASYLYLSYGTNTAPQVSVALAVQDVHFINEGTRPERVYPVRVALVCPVGTNGVLDVEWQGSDGALYAHARSCQWRNRHTGRFRLRIPNKGF